MRKKSHVSLSLYLIKNIDNQLLSDHKKNPQPKMLMLTLKRVKEMFPNMEDIEYKIGTSEIENI